jgi:hypothetical protein
MRRVMAFVLALIVAWGFSLQQVAVACYVNLTPYPDRTNVNSGAQFVWGQTSQGGNYYYGTYGGIGYTSPAPPAPTDGLHTQEHINAFLSSQQSPPVSGNCCWSSAGWHIGYNQYTGGTTYAPTSYSEMSDTLSYVFTVGDPALSSSSAQYYQTIQNGQLGNGLYRYDSYWYYGGTWKFGGYAELSSAATQSVAAGEATNPLSIGTTREPCRQESASGQDNRMSSLSLYVSGVGWQLWRPSPEGRWADVVTDAPYHRTPITDYTDMGVGGPQ